MTNNSTCKKCNSIDTKIFVKNTIVYIKCRRCGEQRRYECTQCYGRQFETEKLFTSGLKIVFSGFKLTCKSCNRVVIE